MTDKQSSKNGAASTWHAKNDDKRRAEARRLIAAVNGIDARDWLCLIERRAAIQEALEA